LSRRRSGCGGGRGGGTGGGGLKGAGGGTTRSLTHCQYLRGVRGGQGVRLGAPPAGLG
jgi:hypothetical protein